ncbi:MAG: hypothetical protein KBA33_04995 [Cloacibacterium sp.]|jgi:hypothetical protein|nr:hypothetical protein [Cloacibacterium sp.]
MKYFFSFFVFLFLFVSCRNEDADLQKIDQVTSIYIKDVSGKDLLNSKLSGTYTSVALKDLNGIYDLVPITTFSLKKDADTVNYIEYIAGAKRILKDSVSASQKSYQSDFVIHLSKVVDNTTVTDVDTLRMEYSWTPTLFQISKAYYNENLVFSKTEGQSNIIKVVK